LLLLLLLHNNADSTLRRNHMYRYRTVKLRRRYYPKHTRKGQCAVY